MESAQAKPLLVTFARPEESRAFRRRLVDPRAGRIGGTRVLRGKIGNIELVVAHLGIGPDSAEQAMRALLAGGPWWMVFAAGFAGGLDPKLSLGDVVMEELKAGKTPRLISRALPVETVADKARLRAETGADAVDMETDTVRSLCAETGLAVLAIRAISDPASAALPVPMANWFDLRLQRPRPLALVAYLLRQPRAIGPFVRFVWGLRSVAQALSFAVESAVCGLEHH